MEDKELAYNKKNGHIFSKRILGGGIACFLQAWNSIYSVHIV